MTTAWIITCLGLMILPGPDMALVTKQSLAEGWRGGSSAVAGIYASFLLYSLAILLGLIPLLNSWPIFFTLARIFGGAYLIYLGLVGIRQGIRKEKIPPAGRSLRRLARAGFVSNALNAKQYLFLFLLLPAFLPPNPSWTDSLYLLLILLLVSTVFWIFWISALSRLRDRISGHHRRIEVISSGALLLVGVLLILGFL